MPAGNLEKKKQSKKRGGIPNPNSLSGLIMNNWKELARPVWDMLRRQGFQGQRKAYFNKIG